MPSSTMQLFSSSGSSSLLPRSNLESSLILNRISTMGVLNNTYVNPDGTSSVCTTPYDSILLNLELKRHERKRQLMRFGSIRWTDEPGEAEAGSGRASSSRKKPAAEVKDKLGNLVYRRGEKDQDRYARELDQWVKKMKCTGMTGQRLDGFREIKVGVCPDAVSYKSPSLEPYPLLKNETFTFKGGKDRLGRFKGKGVIEFANGDLVTGSFDNNMRHGECRVETSRNGVSVIIGQYENDQLSGKAKVIFQDGTWLEGFFKEGVLHGFARKFDEDGRLVFVGNHRNGLPHGVCWHVVRGGGFVVGRVDDEGELSGIRIAYLYPDYRTAFVGTFCRGVMEFAQTAHLKTVIDDRGIKIPIFSEPNGRLYKREIATKEKVTDDPLLPDPYESRVIEVRESHVDGAGSGLFARIRLEQNTVVAFYNGLRIPPTYSFEHPDWEYNAYKIFDPAVNNGTLDIPAKYRQLANYNASLAHKTNHSFLPNAEFIAFDHPRFGMIPCLLSTHDIEAGEEVFVHYGYELDNCPEWYEAIWLKGSHPVPDSMKDEYMGTDDGDSSSGGDDKNKEDQHKLAPEEDGAKEEEKQEVAATLPEAKNELSSS